MVVVPFRDFASFDQEVEIDKVPYRIKFDYNVRFGFWTVGFRNRDETVIISGVKLVLGYDLFEQYQGVGLPPGELYVIDTTSEIRKINRDNLVSPLEIVYFEAADL